MSRYTKRSFLLQVVGFAGAGLAAGSARGQSADFRLPGYNGSFEYRYTPAEDPRAQQQPQRQGAPTGVTDQDSTDRQQYGRGTAEARSTGYTGVSDQDPTDRQGYGHSRTAPERPYTGLNDSDSSPGDPAGYGRPR